MKRNNLKGKRFSRETQREESSRPRAGAAAGTQLEFPATPSGRTEFFRIKASRPYLLLALNLMRSSGCGRSLSRQLCGDHLLRLHANDPVDQTAVLE